MPIANRSFAKKPAWGNEFTSGSRAFAASAAVLRLVIPFWCSTVPDTTMIDQVISCDANMPTALSNRILDMAWLEILTVPQGPIRLAALSSSTSCDASQKNKYGAIVVPPAPRLHPNIAEVYRRKVEELHSALKEGDAGPARELVRGLVEAIVLMPENGRLRVEVRGQLAAILRLSGLANEKAPAGSPELLAEQIKLVAGAGFEPAAFRL
jgi:hypothetical protein